MTSNSTTQAPSKIIMLAPMALVLILFGYVFNSPQQSQLKRAQTRLKSLSDSQHNTQHEIAEVLANRAKSRQAERELTAELDQERIRQDVSLQRLTKMRRELLSASQPVATVQNVSRLLGQHQLKILSSQPDSASSETARRTVTTLVSLLTKDESGQTAADLSKQVHREVYRLKLTGRFEDVRQALEALSEAHQNVVTLSLEMARLELEAATKESKHRIWYLTIMV